MAKLLTAYLSFYRMRELKEVAFKRNCRLQSKIGFFTLILDVSRNG